MKNEVKKREIMDRRFFLKVSALSTLAACVPLKSGLVEAGAGAEPDPVRAYSELGVQLYTVRSLFETDYLSPLKALADIGYKDIEFAGLFAHDPYAVKAFLDELGLVSRSSHVQLADVKDNFEQVLEIADIMGQTNLVVPWIAPELRNPDSYKALSELLNRRGQEAKARGRQIAYHNHDFEFETVEGESGYGILLRETDPDLVKMEIDLFWSHKAGIDPVALFKRAPGRFIACHVKDASPSGAMVPIGEGVIDFQAIFAHAEMAGLKHFYVEDDTASDPLGSLGKSYAHLKM